ADAIKIIRAGNSILRHAGAGRWTKSGETSRRWIGKGGEGRVRRSYEIHMEMIGGVIWISGLTGKSYESVWSACWRQGRPVEVCRQKGIDRSTERADRTYKCSGLPS